MNVDNEFIIVGGQYCKYVCSFFFSLLVTDLCLIKFVIQEINCKPEITSFPGETQNMWGLLYRTFVTEQKVICFAVITLVGGELKQIK